MSLSKSKAGLCVLQWALGVVILIEAVIFMLPGAARSVASMHVPSLVQLVLGIGEILGSVLLLIPKTTTRGAWLLLAVFVAAILVHLSHGTYNIGNLVVYAAATFAIAVGK